MEPAPVSILLGSFHNAEEKSDLQDSESFPGTMHLKGIS
jgi:hypothetical protein